MDTILHFACFKNDGSLSEKRTETSFRLPPFYGGLGLTSLLSFMHSGIKAKAIDVCVREKQENCYICLKFTPDQVNKLKAKKI